jgi:hypothetical protein
MTDKSNPVPPRQPLASAAPDLSLTERPRWHCHCDRETMGLSAKKGAQRHWTDRDKEHYEVARAFGGRDFSRWKFHS